MTKARQKFKTCGKCGEVLIGKNFKDFRFCYGADYRNRYKFGIYCVKCEPYPKQPKHRWEVFYGD